MDFKNIQRRVYDALNVLDALGIIQKDNRTTVMYVGEQPDNSATPPDLSYGAKPSQTAEISQSLLQKRRRLDQLKSLVKASQD